MEHGLFIAYTLSVYVTSYGVINNKRWAAYCGVVLIIATLLAFFI